MNTRTRPQLQSSRLLVWMLAVAAACSAAPEPGDGGPGSPPPDAASVGPGHDVIFGSDRGAVARRGADGKASWASPRTITLHNRGAYSFPWLLESSVPWLGSVRANRGYLGAGQRLEIELAIDAATAPSERGVFLAELRLLNFFTFHQQAAVEVTWIVETGPATERLPIGLDAAGRTEPHGPTGLQWPNGPHGPPGPARRPAQR